MYSYVIVFSLQRIFYQLEKNSINSSLVLLLSFLHSFICLCLSLIEHFTGVWENSDQTSNKNIDNNDDVGNNNNDNNNNDNNNNDNDNNKKKTIILALVLDLRFRVLKLVTLIRYLTRIHTALTLTSLSSVLDHS